MSGGFDWVFWSVGGVLGLAGLLLAVWALFADRARGRRRCPKCWYDLSGTPGLVCSECGYVAKRERRLRKTHRRWRWVLVGACIGLAAYTISVTPRTRRSQYGWAAVIPTTALLVAAPWLDVEGAPVGELGGRLATDAAWNWQQAWYAGLLVARYRRSAGQDRVWALHGLGIIGPEAEGNLPLVLGAISDADANVRSAAAYAIGMILRESEASVPALLDLLADDDAAVRESAAWGLWKFGPEGTEALPALATALKDESERVRVQSAVALARIGGDPEIAIPILAQALESSDSRPIGAVFALAELGPRVVGVIPALRAAVHHQDKTVRLIAVTCLGEMGPDAAAAIPDLIELLDDRQFAIWLWAAYALGEIGPAAEGAVPALSKLIDDEDADTRQVAREALQKIRRDRGSSEDE